MSLKNVITTDKDRIYLDYAATTPIAPAVIEKILPFFGEYFGNASSLHSYGVEAKTALQFARAQLAETLSCHADELVFTSGGSESNNMALKGVAFANRSKGNHIIVSSIEHDCVLKTCKWLESQGFFITYLPVNEDALIDLDLLERCINPKTILVSVMHVNNETGTIQEINIIGEICQRKGVLFHSDACQSFGKMKINTQNIDLLSINSHKIYGPKGIGALMIKKGVNISPLLHGGGQEYGYRASTENVAGVIGFAEAAKLCYTIMDQELTRVDELQTYLVNELTRNIPGIYFNGHQSQRLPHILNFCISGLEGETIRLMLLLDEMGIAVSSGSACSSNGGDHASHVLQAIGLDAFRARGSIRLSLGRATNYKQLNTFLTSLYQSINQLNPIFSII